MVRAFEANRLSPVIDRRFDLGTIGLPAEIAALVAAKSLKLDFMAAAYDAGRRIIMNPAHALPTPLDTLQSASAACPA